MPSQSPETALATLTEWLDSTPAPDRQMDALLAMCFIASQVESNPRIWVLDDNPSLPLVMVWEKAPTEALLTRLGADGQEVLYFEYYDRWLHFVSDRVPKFTSSLDAALSLCERLAPDFQWSVRKGGATLTHGTLSISFENKIPAIALVGATLRAKTYSLRQSSNDYRPDGI